MKPGRRFTEVESCSIVSLRCRGTWRGDVICNITARSSLSPPRDGRTGCETPHVLRAAIGTSWAVRGKVRTSSEKFNHRTAVRRGAAENAQVSGCSRWQASCDGRGRHHDTSLQPASCVDAGGHPDRERGLPRSLHAESNRSRFAFLPRGRLRYGRWRVVARPHLSARRGRRRGSS